MTNLNIQQVIVASSSVDSPICVWDLDTGTLLSSFRSSSSPSNALCCIGSEYFASSQELKSGGAISFWSWEKSNVLLKCHTPEAIGPLACSNDGAFLAGGGVSGRIYLWEVASGIMLRSWPAHYKKVTTIAFSDDDAVIISSAEDAVINVWSLFKIFDNSGGHNDVISEKKIFPLHKLCEHQQKINQVYLGRGGINSIFVSASSDRCCKIWRLSNGCLLRSIIFPSSINCIILDPNEYFLYAGGLDGRIYLTPLNFGVSLSPDDNDPSMNADDALIGHEGPISALSFSMDGICLVSASFDFSVKIWDAVSKQLLRTFNHSKIPMSCVMVVPYPKKLHQTSSDDKISKANGNSNSNNAALPLAMLRKYPEKDKNGKYDSDTWDNSPFLVPSFAKIDSHFQNFAFLDSSVCASYENLLRNFNQLEKKESIVSMQMECEKLKSECSKALVNGESWKKEHKKLYQFVINEIVKFDEEIEKEKLNMIVNENMDLNLN